MLRRRFDADGYVASVPVSAPPVVAASADGRGTGAVQVPVAAAGVPAPAAPVPAAPIRWSVTPSRPGLGEPSGPGGPGGPGEPEPAATATNGAQTLRLPIYESVESDWFRRSGKYVAAGDGTPASSWTSPADEGFRAARAVISPAAGETTSAGLPRRVPSANLVPGSVGGGLADQQAKGATGPQPAASSASRSPDEVRSRLAELQQGARRGRAEAPWNFGADES
jgi:hypothetical protein